MTVPEELLAILVCPRCLGPLEPRGEGLACRRCELCFPVREGIPVLVVEEAHPCPPG